jgi:hypothetical protein
MGAKIFHSSVWALVRRQHGVVTGYGRWPRGGPIQLSVPTHIRRNRPGLTLLILVAVVYAMGAN